MAAKNISKSTPPRAAAPPAKVAKPEAPRMRTFAPGFWRAHWLPSAILFALAFALYAIGISYGYVLDDELVLWKNEYVQKGFAGLRDIFAKDSFMGYFKEQKFLLEGGRYRPLSLATFAIEVEFFGSSQAAISHFVNVLLYGLTGVLLYRILLGLFPLREGARWYFSLPFVAAAIFVLHPLHVECVANIKGRDEILALLGGLGALWAALKYCDTDKWGYLLLSCTALLLGMFAKENVLTFVAVVPLTLWFFRRATSTQNVLVSLLFALAALIFIVVRFKALGYMLNPSGRLTNDLMNNPFLGMSLGEKLATTFLSLGWYLKLLLVPHPLTHDYYPYQVPKVGWGDWRALLSLACYLGMAVWAVLNVRKRRVPAYAILFFLLTLSIVSNLFVSVGTFMNERFLFMPSVAFCLLAGWFFTRQLPDWVSEKHDSAYPLGLMIAGAVAALFAWRTVARVPDWKNALSLNTSAVRASPNSARAHCFYVTAIYENVYQPLQRSPERLPWIDTMEYHIKRALEIYPNYSAALVMKGAVTAARFEQDHELDKCLHEFEGILEKIPYSTNFRTFLDSYLEYLDGSNADKYVSFCKRVGYDLYYKKLRDAKTAQHFLEFGLNRQTEDVRILDALVEVYNTLGERAKAEQMKARAAAQR
jgi:hypothetical protein